MFFSEGIVQSGVILLLSELAKNATFEEKSTDAGE
jgi:hypothetical protein